MLYRLRKHSLGCHGISLCEVDLNMDHFLMEQHLHTQGSGGHVGLRACPSLISLVKV